MSAIPIGLILTILAGGPILAETRLETGQGNPDRTWRFRDRIALPGSFPVALMEDSRAWLWVGTEGDGLWVFDQCEWECISRAPGTREGPTATKDATGISGCGLRRNLAGIPAESVTALCETPDGHVWVGTAHDGLWEWDTQDWRRHDVQRGLAGVRIHDLLARAHDGAGWDLWVGTENGVNRYASGVWSNGSLAGSWPSAPVTAIAADEASPYGEAPSPDASPVEEDATIGMSKTERVRTLYAGTAESGVYRRIGDGPWTRLELPGWPDPLRVNDLLCDRQGTLWVATSDGLGCVNVETDPKWCGPRDTKAAAWGCYVIRLTEDVRGDIWVSTRTEGLWRVAGEAAELDPVNEPTVHDFPYAMLFDRQGNLWVGQYGGGLSVLRRYPRHIGWRWGTGWLLWDGKNLRAFNSEAQPIWANDPYVRQPSRRGWVLAGLHLDDVDAPIMEFRVRAGRGSETRWIGLSPDHGEEVTDGEGEPKGMAACWPARLPDAILTYLSNASVDSPRPNP